MSRVRDMADAMGVSLQTVYAWRRRPDWTFGKSGPWDVDAVRAWRDKLQPIRGIHTDPEGDGAAGEFPLVYATGDPKYDAILCTMTPLRQAELRKRNEQANAAAFENLVTQKGLIPREEVERGWADRARRVRVDLTGLPRRLADDLVGLSKPEIERRLLDAVEEICRRYAGE